MIICSGDNEDDEKPSPPKPIVKPSPPKSIIKPLPPPKLNYAPSLPKSNAKLKNRDENVQNIDSFDTAINNVILGNDPIYDDDEFQITIRKLNQIYQEIQEIAAKQLNMSITLDMVLSNVTKEIKPEHKEFVILGKPIVYWIVNLISVTAWFWKNATTESMVQDNIETNETSTTMMMTTEIPGEQLKIPDELLIMSALIMSTLSIVMTLSLILIIIIFKFCKRQKMNKRDIEVLHYNKKKNIVNEWTHELPYAWTAL
ncbi:hypothetical protein BLA29_005936 [Euroglyphus maynei]|uniref:Uncharacterized protein n=1 Tax=Euroglyphus maynei TaxID=6958 RepID=A0A1Y3AW97_EURMA|nr:hypothetical protein BLA29_005936 [Euroglyphus maynei]